MTLITELQRKLKEIFSNDWKKGIEYLTALAKTEENFINHILLLNSNYKKIQKNHTIGILSDSDFSTERNKCCLAIFELIDSLEIYDFNDYRLAINVVIYGNDLPDINSMKIYPRSSEEKLGNGEYQAIITNHKKIYSTIHQTKCINWPTEEIRQKSGKRSWGGFRPQNGMIGYVIGHFKHCKKKENIYLLKINRFFIPIGETGLEIIY